MIKVRDQTLTVDIRTELSAFEWTRPRWTNDKLIAASPFRYDNTPSFFVKLEGEYAGTWADSGHYDADYASGGIVKLLAFLRNESSEETEDYLIETYGITEGKRQRLVVPSLKQRESFTPLSETLIEVLTSPYLTKRGISTEVQEQVGVGKSAYKGFVAIPWRLPDGRLSNVKYRSTMGKTFYYEKGGWAIRRSVWGAYTINKTENSVILCEAEIDAMSWMTAGYQAMAVGGVAFNREQADIIRSLPISRLIIAGDNDKAGVRFNESVVQALRNDVRLAVLTYTHDMHKDANEILRNEGTEALRELADNSVGISSLNAVLRV